MKLTIKMIKFLKSIEIFPIKDKISFRKLYLAKNDIFQKASSQGCDEYDLDNIVSSKTFKIGSVNKKADDKLAEKIKFLQNLCFIFNKMIAMNAIKTKYWENNVQELKEYVERINKKKVSSNIINDLFIKLLNKYVYSWSGFWDMIDYTSKGEIKSVETFDYDDKEYIRKQVLLLKKK
jgi:hypothetical protein